MSVSSNVGSMREKSPDPGSGVQSERSGAAGEVILPSSLVVALPVATPTV